MATTATNPDLNPPARRAYSVAEVLTNLDCSRVQLYRILKSGALRAVKHGRRTLILSDDLERYLATLPAWTPRHGGAS